MKFIKSESKKEFMALPVAARKRQKQETAK